MERFKFAVEERVRYQHVDIQGIVYYARYVEWLEIGRMEYLRHLGITSKSMNEKGYDFVNVEVHCQFKKPAHLDEVILICTRLAWIKNSSFGFDYLFQEKETKRVLVTANTTHVMVNVNTFKPIRVPQEYRTLFQEFEGNLLNYY